VSIYLGIAIGRLAERRDLEVSSVDNSQYSTMLNTGLDNPDAASRAPITHLNSSQVGCEVEVNGREFGVRISNGATHKKQLAGLQGRKEGSEWCFLGGSSERGLNLKRL
jgi:hypothetical protein